MRRCPYPLTYRRYEPYEAHLRRTFEVLRAEAERRLAPIPAGPGVGRGFGTVFVIRPSERARCLLMAWGWRQVAAADYPLWLGADSYMDDPLGADPAAALGERMAAAEAVAAAANALFHPADGRFLARPLEVVEASPSRPPGVYPGGGSADVLAMDLMMGVPHPRIIDRLCAGIFIERWQRGLVSDGSGLQEWVWERLQRLNAARSMFRPGIPEVKVPGPAAMRRRQLILEERWHSTKRSE